jgi:hypothetical protein
VGNLFCLLDTKARRFDAVGHAATAKQWTSGKISNYMGSPSKAPNVSMGEDPKWPELSKSDILAELEHVLQSHHFSASKKCSRFLRHVVEAAADARLDCLKERTLGVDVFDREPHYDTNQDPIVRGTAGEVRKRLAQYYLEPGDHKLRLTLPPGSYIPEVHPLSPQAEVAPAATSATEEPAAITPAIEAPRHKYRRLFLIPGMVVLTCSAIGTVLWLWPRPSTLDRFWAPILARNTVLVCMGQPQLYTFRTDTLTSLNQWFDQGFDRRPSDPPPSVPLSEIVPMWNIPLALVDAQAFSRLGNLFAQKHKRVDLRGERLITLSDLRGKPAVFIGAFDNHWALNFARDLRFYFDADQRTHTQSIRDREKPAAAKWQLVDAWPPGRAITEDYALVTRVFNPTTEQTIVILGGIAQYGTDAAAEFVTDPGYFQQALEHAPRDWSKKNIQVVLSTKVLSGVGGPPTVLAVHIW